MGFQFSIDFNVYAWYLSGPVRNVWICRFWTFFWKDSRSEWFALKIRICLKRQFVHYLNNFNFYTLPLGHQHVNCSKYSEIIFYFKISSSSPHKQISSSYKNISYKIYTSIFRSKPISRAHNPEEIRIVVSIRFCVLCHEVVIAGGIMLKRGRGAAMSWAGAVYINW